MANQAHFHISRTVFAVKESCYPKKEGHPAISAVCHHVLGEQNMMHFIPTHPSQNRHIDEGVYDAEIREITESVYDIDSHLIHLLLWLPEEDLHICTNFYFPHGYSIRSQQRMWHMCQAVGLELHQVIDEAEQFTGRRLRIKIYSVNQDGVMHSDVELFLAQAQQQIDVADTAMAHLQPPK